MLIRVNQFLHTKLLEELDLDRKDHSGITNGVANVGLFYVPPINCKTPKSVNNIPNVSQIGDEIFGGIIAIVTEAGADVTINGNPIATYGAIAEVVNANTLYESYTVEGLIGNINVESTAQVYVATLGHMITLLLGATIRGLNLNLKLFLRL